MLLKTRKFLYSVYSFLDFNKKLNAGIFFSLAIITLILKNLSFGFQGEIAGILGFLLGLLYILAIEISLIKLLSIKEKINLKPLSFSLNLTGFYSTVMLLSYIAAGFYELTSSNGFEALNFIIALIILLVGLSYFALMNYFQLKETMNSTLGETVSFMFIALILGIAGMQLLYLTTLMSVSLVNPGLY